MKNFEVKQIVTGDSHIELYSNFYDCQYSAIVDKSSLLDYFAHEYCYACVFNLCNNIDKVIKFILVDAIVKIDDNTANNEYDKIVEIVVTSHAYKKVNEFAELCADTLMV